MKSLDELSWEEKQFALVRGVLAGNVFDWGAKAVSEWVVFFSSLASGFIDYINPAAQAFRDTKHFSLSLEVLKVLLFFGKLLLVWAHFSLFRFDTYSVLESDPEFGFEEAKRQLEGIQVL